VDAGTGLLHPGLMQAMMPTRLMQPCGNGGSIREHPVGSHGSRWHDLHQYIPWLQG